MKRLFENCYNIIVTFCQIIRERDRLIKLKTKLFTNECVKLNL